MSILYDENGEPLKKSAADKLGEAIRFCQDQDLDPLLVVSQDKEGRVVLVSKLNYEQIEALMIKAVAPFNFERHKKD